MRLLLVIVILLVAGCDSPTEERGSFAASLSGARTASLSGDASFLQLQCRSVDLRDGDTALYLNTSCRSGDYRDAIRRGVFQVTSAPTDSSFFVSLYDDATRAAYHSVGGTVEITSESEDRIEGRLDITARRFLPDNRIDSPGTPLRIVGSFDARGFVGLD